MQSNPDLRAKYQKVLSAKAEVTIAESYRLPKLQAISSFIQTDQPAQVFALTLNQERFDMESFFMSDPNQPETLDTYMSRLDLSLPLYTGGQISHGIKAARKAHQGTLYQWERQKQILQYQVAEVYLGILLAEEMESTIQHALKTVERHVKMAEDYYHVGMITQGDVLRAQVEKGKVEDLLLKVQNQKRTARIALNILMGEDPEKTWEYKTPDVLMDLTIPDPKESFPLALAQRKDYQAYLVFLESLKENLFRMKAQRFPTIGVSAQMDWYDDRFLGNHGDNATLAIALKLPLFTGGELKGKVHQAQAMVNEVKEQMEQMKDGIFLQLQEAYGKVLEGKKRWEVGKGKVEAAKKNLSIMEERYKKGVAKIVDLLDADTALREAQTRLTQAKHDFLLAYEHYILTLGKEE